MRSLMVLLCYVYVTSGQEQVFLTSRNFINVLRWTAAEQRFPGEKILYSVLYNSDTDGEEFKKKAECQNITELFCDLTEETPPVYDVYYRAKVQVRGSVYGQTRKFKPVAITVLGAPLVSPIMKKTTLHVDAKPPLGRNNASVSDIFKKIKIGANDPTIYSFIITKPLRAVQEMENTTGHFEVDLKDSQVEYCGYVVYKPALEWGRPVSEKAEFCVTPPGQPWWPWATLSAVLLLLLFTAAVVCAKCYVTKMKKTWPQSLLGFSPQHVKDPNQLLMHPEEGHISKPEILTHQEREKMVWYANIRTIAAAPSALESGYGHTHSFSSWQEEFNLHSPTLRYQDDSFGSSVVYGGVTVQDEENGDLHQLQSETKESQEWEGPGFLQSGAIVSPQTILSVVDSHDTSEGQPLLLPTQRDSDGLLTLSMLLQPMTEITEGGIVSPQTKQLLPYLKLSSDLGVNFGSLQSLESSVSDENSLLTPTQDYGHSHYLSNQQNFASLGPDSSCEDSGIYDTPYKQNMMPHLCSLKYS